MKYKLKEEDEERKVYDDIFKHSEAIKDKFKKTMDTIGTIYGDELENSHFNSKPLFYTLFCILFSSFTH